MTRTHYQQLSLEDVVRRSVLIVAAQKTEPFTFNELMSILPKKSQYKDKNEPPYYQPGYGDGKPDNLLDKNFPPFVNNGFSFEILDLLYSHIDYEYENNKNIRVLDAFWERRYELHKGYYLEGKRKSPIYQSYRTSIEDLEGYDLPMILMLKKNQENQCFELCVFQSYEALNYQEEVLAAVKKL